MRGVGEDDLSQHPLTSVLELHRLLCGWGQILGIDTALHVVSDLARATISLGDDASG